MVDQTKLKLERMVSISRHLQLWIQECGKVRGRTQERETEA